jgi:hypothetical protein
MEEYKALREEIVRLEKEILQITFYVLTASIAIAGLASKNSQFIEIIPILYQVVLIWGIDRYIISSRLRTRLSTYIQVFIEPKHNELNWEKRNSSFKITTKLNGNIWKWVRRLSNLLSLLFLIGIYVSFTYFISIECFDLENIIVTSILLLLQIFGLIFLIIGVFYYPDPNEYLRKWHEIKKGNKKE